MKRSHHIEVLGSAGAAGIYRIAGVGASLGIWIALSMSGAVNSLLLPPPWRVLSAIQDIGSSLPLHIIATLARVLVGFLGGILLGSCVGIVMQYNRYAFSILDGMVETGRPIPTVALIPFFTLIFGFSETGRFLVVALGTALLAAVTVVESIERVPASIVRWGLVVGLGRAELFRRILLPAAWPSMRTGFRLGLALSFALVIVAEFMGATYGLGHLISVAKVTLTTPTLLLCIAILGLLGWLTDKALRLLFDRTAHWEVSVRDTVL
jgi:ABC-type nitrate/sulfonate/bicarbonate transport system permease component